MSWESRISRFLFIWSYFLYRFVISLSVEHSAWKISCSFLDFSSSISSVIVVSCWFNFICWMGFKILVFSFFTFSSFRSVTLALSFFLTVLYLFSIGLKWFIQSWITSFCISLWSKWYCVKIMWFRIASSVSAIIGTDFSTASASFATFAFNSRSILLSARICRLISQRSAIMPFFSIFWAM